MMSGSNSPNLNQLDYAGLIVLPQAATVFKFATT